MGKDFSTADKGKTFKRGGEMATKMDPKMMAMMAKKRAAPAAPAAPGTGMMGMKKGGSAKAMPTSMGSVKTAAPSRDGVASKGKTKGTMIKMKKGGKAC